MNDSNTANWNRQRMARSAWKQAILFVFARYIIKMFKNKQAIYNPFDSLRTTQKTDCILFSQDMVRIGP